MSGKKILHEAPALTIQVDDYSLSIEFLSSKQDEQQNMDL